MLTGPPDGFRWPAPWRPLADTEASTELVRPLADPFNEEALGFTFEAELQREVCLGHPLYGVECRAMGRNRDDFNEFVLATANPQMPVAFVHLTWQVESTPTFPYTVGYPCWEAFRAAWEESDAS